MRTFLKSAPSALLRRNATGLRFCSSSVTPTPCTTLTQDEQDLFRSVDEFAKSVIKPHVREMDEKSKMTPEIIKACFDQGLMGIEVPEKYGGADMTFMSAILAIEALAMTDPSICTMVDVHNTLVNSSILRWANEEHKKEYLPRLANSCLGSFCLTEQSSGSDAFALKTRAEKKGDSYVINGSKMWITNSGEAEIFLVMANADPSKGYKGITCFLVDKTVHKGVKVAKKEDKLGIRASSTCEVQFEDVVVPASNIIGEFGKGYKLSIEILNEGRIGIAAQMLGAAQGAMRATMPFLFERKQFGKPIGEFQGMQFQYAQAETEIFAARLMIYNAARKQMRGEPFVKDAAMAKLFACQVAERVTSRCIEWMGGVGFTKDYPVEKFYRDVKIGSIYEGTSNIQLHTIAKIMLNDYGISK